MGSPSDNKGKVMIDSNARKVDDDESPPKKALAERGWYPTIAPSATRPSAASPIYTPTSKSEHDSSSYTPETDNEIKSPIYFLVDSSDNDGDIPWEDFGIEIDFGEAPEEDFEEELEMNPFDEDPLGDHPTWGDVDVFARVGEDSHVSWIRVWFDGPHIFHMWTIAARARPEWARSMLVFD